MTLVTVLTMAAFGLEQIGTLLKSPTATDAGTLLAAITKIYEAIEGATAGHITPDDARSEIAALMATLKSNDAAADKALADKFATKELLP
jgi:hypothetical protein